MLRNRVNPGGDIFTTPARGRFMGNRGLLHDADKNIVRQFKLKAWITCRLEFKGWKRPLMAPGQYTELFFLDEATSFAAGHRPCFECRREDALRFKMAWIKGNPEYGFDAKTSIRLIDEIIHADRTGTTGVQIVYPANPASLPDGTFILVRGESYLIKERKLYRWTAFGYEDGVPFFVVGKVMVQTPESIVNAFKAGYVPQVSIGQNRLVK
jgi:hypothetical protein